MNVMGWLEQQEMGFSQVEDHERRIIMEFSLLWSLFECKVLETDASIPKIKEATQHWPVAVLLKEDSFTGALAYFRERYVSDNEFTSNFYGLNLQSPKDKVLVERVLQKSPNLTDWEEVVGILIIIYRLRNNLFHGVKWAYSLQGQHDNFYWANAALMTAIQHGKKSAGGTS